MGIEDIQISEELETNAPSIRYRGDEGPKSPQQEQMMMLIQKLMSQGMGQEEAMQMAQQMMAEAEQQQMAQQQMPPPQMAPQGMPPRQMAAFGGIMGLDGRRQYGWGSKIKDRIRKLIPNEVAKIAEVAAPFVAPFNPLAAGLMSGIGGFDRTGRIGSSIKSGLMNYGMGQLSRGIGGGTQNLQSGFNPAGGFGDATRMGTGFGKYFSSPMQSSGGLGKYFADSAATKGQIAKDTALRTSDAFNKIPGGGDPAIFNKNYIGDTIAKNPLSKAFSKISEYVPKSFGALNPFGENFDIKQAVGALGIFKVAEKLLGGPEQAVDDIMDRGEGLDIAGIRAEVTEAFKDETGAKLAALRSKYPYLGTQASKNTAIMAMGGRAGYGLGNLVTGSSMAEPVSASMSEGDAPVMPSSGMGGMLSTLINNNPQLFKNVSGQNNSSSSAMPSRGMGGMFSKFFSNPRMYNQYFRNQEDFIDENFNDIDDREEVAMGGRIRRAEGGLMDLGGMEKDYRAEGGFVPIGEYEKKDDVPARLSVNEFVFTADAVRGAGQGDIDKGAEIMENMMENLENGGTISEESQGKNGAQQMFETSQRLGEVV
jgi:hypothetical protein